MFKDSLETSIGASAADRRAAVERANAERAAARLSRLEEQSSPLLSARERIERWESLHGLRLPADHNHKLVRVIALATSLAADQVRAEQTRRKELAVGHLE